MIALNGIIGNLDDLFPRFETAVPAPTSESKPTKSHGVQAFETALQTLIENELRINRWYDTHPPNRRGERGDQLELVELADLLDDEATAIESYIHAVRALPNTDPAHPKHPQRKRGRTQEQIGTEIDAKNAQKRHRDYLDQLKYDDPEQYEYETVTRPCALAEAAARKAERKSKDKDLRLGRGGHER